jgi:hypothetical protein
MRARHVLVLVTLGFGGTGLIGAGCGGSTNTATDGGSGMDAPADTSRDVVVADTSPPRDAGMDSPAPVDAPPDVPCTVDADLTMLNPMDASLGNDASVGTCLACAQMNCMPDITACNADCGCKGAISMGFACLGAGMPIQTCLAGALTNSAAQALGICIFGACVDACDLNMFFPDGGGDSPAGDAVTEAAADGAGE